MDLVGRDVELQALRSAVEGVSAGDVQAVVLDGEAGIGKSALVAAAAELATQAGMLVLEGRAAEHEGDVPFGAVVDALDDHVASFSPRRRADLGSELGAVLPSLAQDGASPSADPAQRFRYHRALRALLEQLGRERPVALILDDLHWADEATVELALHLLRRPPRAPLLLLTALRPSPTVNRLVEAGRAAPAFHRLELHPLRDADARQLLGTLDSDELRAQVLREAAGNPLYLVELARAAPAPDQLPATLLAAIELEIGRLSPASRAMLEGAAVAGDPFDPELAAAATDIDQDVLVAIDALARADVIRPTSDGRLFAFRHPLVRRAVYDGAPPAWRLAAHERVAAALIARGARAATVAQHVAACARPGDAQAIELLSTAGAESATTSPAAAVRWYGTALQLVPPTDANARLAVLAPLAGAQFDAGRLDAARQALVEILETLPEELTPARLALLSQLARIESWMGEMTLARNRLERSRQEAPSELAGEVLATTAVAEFFAGAFDRAASAAADAEAVAAPHTALHVVAASTRANAEWWAGAAQQSIDRMDAAARDLDALPDDAFGPHLLDAFASVSGGLKQYGRHSRAAAVARRGLKLAEESDQGRMLTPVRLIYAETLGELLQLDAAVAQAEVAEESSRLMHSDSQLHWALIVLADCHRLTGDAPAGRAVLEEAVRIEAGLESGLLLLSAGVTIAIIHGDDDPERGMEELRRLHEGDHEMDPTNQLRVAIELAANAARAGHADLAQQYGQAGIALADRYCHPVARVGALSAYAEGLLLADRADEALTALDGAAAAARAVGGHRIAMRATITHGRALAATGQRDAAVSVLREAAHAAAAGGAIAERDRASRELRRIGARLDTATLRASGPAALELTSRERDIADLVLQGLPNKRVAAQLFISEKTVEYHLSNLYAKAGVRSRVELAAVLG